MKAVPAAQRSAGYFFAKAEYLRKQKKFTDAAAVVMQAPTDREALVDPDAWWVERRVLSRELVDLGDMKTAYQHRRRACGRKPGERRRRRIPCRLVCAARPERSGSQPRPISPRSPTSPRGR